MKPQPPISPFWVNWLLVVVLGVMAFGISMVLLPGPIRMFFSLIFYSSAGAMDARFGPAAVEYVTFAHGVLGAVMFGWGAALLMVLYGPFRRGSREGWRIFAVSVGAWFVPDTLFSLWTGFWQNAVLNAVFAALFAVPLVATYKAFGRTEGRSSAADAGQPG